MRVKCTLCDVIESINDESLTAKRLRNRPIHTYMCDKCHERITNRTNERSDTGNFRLYRSAKSKHDF
ncbi:MAG: YlaI family protein [Bacillota bacterium]